MRKNRFISIVVIFLLLLFGLDICLIKTTVNAASDLFREDFSSGTGNWTVNAGTCVIESGEYSLSNLSGTALAQAGSTAWNNYTYEADVKTVGGSYDAAITFRQSDANNYYCLAIRSETWKNTYGPYRLQLYKCVNGIWTSLSYIDKNISDNMFYHYKVIVTGNNIKVYFNNETSVALDYTDTDSTHMTGKIGVRTWLSHAHFDNIMVDKQIYKASVEFSTTAQSNGNWFYKQWTGSQYTNMTYNTQTSAWEGSTSSCFIKDTSMKAGTNDSVRVFSAPQPGTIKISGDIKKKDITGGDGVKAKILKNGTQIWPDSGWQLINNNDVIGYDINITTEVNAYDAIYFVLNKNITDTADETYWNPVVSYITEINGRNVHYVHEDNTVGDPHPYMENGTIYFSHLTPGTNGLPQSELMKTTDMLNYTRTALNHTGTAPLKPWWLVQVTKVGNTYYSWYGAETDKVGESTQLVASTGTSITDWANAAGSYTVPWDTANYRGQRDPYVLWVDEENKYWCIYTARVDGGTRANWGAVGYATSDDLQNWVSQGHLYYPGNTDEQECPQLLKIGDKWYLIGSILQGTGDIYYGGPPSYWVADAPKGPWLASTQKYLDGGDLNAGQLFYNGTKWIMTGWIPKVYDHSVWSGSLVIPREVSQLADGTLAVKAETGVSAKIRGGKKFPSSNWSTVSAISGTWNLLGQTAFTGTGYGLASLEGSYGRMDMDMNISLGTNVKRAGIRLDKPGGSYNYEVVVDRENSQLKVWIPGVYTFSVINISINDWSDVNLRVIVEEDIVEVFLNDKYSLAARICEKMNDNTAVKLCAQEGTAIFNDITIHRLNALDNLN